MNRRVFIGNLHFSTGETELKDLFGQVGTVDSVKLIRDVNTGSSRGFAFIEMASEDDAAKAIAELNDYSLEGRSLTVKVAKPKRRGGFRGDRGFRAGGRGPRRPA